MAVTRRTFLKISASIAALTAAGGFAVGNFIKRSRNLIYGTLKKKGVCPCCPVHCSTFNYLNNDRHVYTAAVPKDRNSSGMLCKKGLLLPYQRKNSGMLEDVLYIRNGVFNKISYAAAVERAADKLRRLRDETFVVKDGDRFLNRSDAVFSLGGCTLTNEEAYLCSKFSRTLGTRECCSDSAVLESTINADTATFGIPAQQNPVYDIENSDAVLVIASNPVRSSTVLAGHIMRARDRGAKLFVIDPMFSETASIADIHLKTLPGSDEILLAGMINYFFRNCKPDMEYLADNTDAGFIVNEEFSFNVEGRFSGFDEQTKSYTDTDSWSYDIDERGNPRLDRRLSRSTCVISHLKDYYNIYTPDYVVGKTGVDGADYLKVCEAFCNTVKTGSAGSVVYGAPAAMSFSLIRLIGIIQILCANIGVPGGGMLNASASMNQQGVRDQMSEGCLPGYLPLPSETDTYETWIKDAGREVNVLESRNLRKELPVLFSALISAWYGNADAEKNFRLLPRRPLNSSAVSVLDDIGNGTVRGLLLFESEIFSSLSADRLEKTLQNLDLVIMCSSSERSESVSKYLSAKGEFFIFPVAPLTGKQGTVTSPDRRISSLVNVTGKKLWTTNTVVTDIFRSVRTLYRIDGGAFPDPLITDIKLSSRSTDINAEISGKTSGNCGNWLYSADIVRTYRPGTGSSQVTLWGDPYLYGRCAITPERKLRQGINSPQIKEMTAEQWFLPFPFIPYGRARLFSSVYSPFPEIRADKENPLAASQAVYNGIERDLVLARRCELRFLSVNDSYTAYFGGESVILSKSSASAAGVISGKEVIVTVPELNESRRLNVLVSDQVADNCAVIISRFWYPRVNGSSGKKVFLEKVI